jgi:hypothetical protein
VKLTMTITVLPDGTFAAAIAEISIASAAANTPEDAAGRAGQYAVDWFGQLVIEAARVALASIGDRTGKS